jgi:hypothetical protein
MKLRCFKSVGPRSERLFSEEQLTGSLARSIASLNHRHRRLPPASVLSGEDMERIQHIWRRAAEHHAHSRACIRRIAHDRWNLLVHKQHAPHEPFGD